MPNNKIAIANLALSKLGARAITSFVESNSNEAEAVNEVYSDILEEVLSEHPWSFAERRTALSYVVSSDVSRTIYGRVFTPVSITAATAADPVQITSADHGLYNGERIKIVGVSGMTDLNGNFYRVADRTADTFTLTNEDTEADIDGTGFTAYTSGGQVQFADEGNPITISGATAADPVVITATAHGLSTGAWIKIVGVSGMTELNDTFFIIANVTANTFSLTDTDGEAIDGSAYTAYGYGGVVYEAVDMPAVDNSTGAIVVYQKPTDMVKPTKKSISGAYFAIEEDKIISDVLSLAIKYTYLCEDTKKYYPKFTDALATRLAAEIAFKVTNSVSKAKELMTLYRDVSLPMAVSSDSVQNTPQEISQDEWLNSLEIGTYPATTGETWHPL